MGESVKTQQTREPRASRPQAPAGYRFPKSLEGMLPWSHARERLESARTYWLATTRPDGRPHATPVWGVWVGDAAAGEMLYFDGAPTTRWARNLAANPAATIHLESGNDVVIVEGVVEDLVTDVETAARVVEAWTVKYGRLVPEPGSSGILRLRPRTVRAWSTSTLEDGTRWHFGDAARSVANTHSD